MRRIMILGAGGSGKSTLAAILSKKLNIKAYHLDTFFWIGDKRIPNESLKEKMIGIANEDEWILDGYYGGLYDERFERADTVIFLIPPTHICIYRIIKRRANQLITRNFKVHEKDLKLKWRFLKWVLIFNRTEALDVIEYLNRYKDLKNILIFKSTKDLNKWFKNIK